MYMVVYNYTRHIIAIRCPKLKFWAVHLVIENDGVDFSKFIFGSEIVEFLVKVFTGIFVNRG